MAFVFDNEQEPKKEEFSEEQNASEPVIEDDEVANDYETPKTPTDPKTIDVRIIDEAPIVLLFGAKSTGKSMTLVRLGRYLRKLGYQLSVDDLFCKTPVWEYKENSQNFNSMLTSDKALKGTNSNDFLLVKVTKKGETVCQILEAAGEDYFPNSIAGKRNLNAEFPPYMTTVFMSRNKKLWTFVTDATWTDNQDCLDYVQRLQLVVDGYCNKDLDKFLLLYNKADVRGFITGDGILNDKAEKLCYGQYDGIQEVFKNPKGTIFSKKYLHDFLAFSTGKYPSNKFIPSQDFVADALWKMIKGKLHI